MKAHHMTKLNTCSTPMNTVTSSGSATGSSPCRTASPGASSAACSPPRRGGTDRTRKGQRLRELAGPPGRVRDEDTLADGRGPHGVHPGLRDRHHGAEVALVDLG